MHTTTEEDFLDKNSSVFGRQYRFAEVALYPHEVWPREVKERVALSDRATIIVVAQRYVSNGDVKGEFGINPLAFDADSLKWVLQVSEACVIFTQAYASFPFAHFMREFRDWPTITYIPTREDFRPEWVKVARHFAGYRAYDLPSLPYEGVRQ
jgi:hypothetical protein